MVNALTERKEAARAYVMTLIEEAFDGFEKAEWATLVKSHNKSVNGGEDMEL